MMDQLSAYILTKNSEKYLREILDKISSVANEIVILDSGSQDKTKEIVLEYSKCSFHFREFDNFMNQRNHAIQLCEFDHVLFVDSDEIPDQILLDSIVSVKLNGFEHDAYEMNREWIVMGKKVHCVYPVKTPDSPIRLINRKYASFDNSSLVHESPSGYRSIGKFDGGLWHYTFHTIDELSVKLDLYTDISAQDIILQNKQISWVDIYIRPVLVFVKYFIASGGYKDGRIGYILAKFAFKNVSRKYKKAREMQAEVI